MDGRVKRETLPDQTPSAAQGWFINLRREKFRDPRVREALGLVFDFEWTNKNIFYGAYLRTASPFQNSDLMATGLPSPEEVALLEPFRGKVPDEVFGLPFVPPVSDGSGRDRMLWRKAQQLLDEAGYRSVGGRRQLPNGEPFRIEFLDEEPITQRYTLPYVKSLETLGIAASLRIVESAQLQVRRNDFDYDFITKRFAMPSTPGGALRSFFSSQSAGTKGSQNLAGIANPALDALIDRIIAADTRDDLRVACRAFDRVFRAGRYWIPQWYLASHRLAYWDVFGRPTTIPRFSGAGAPDIWWSAPAKPPSSGQAK
jgi:microcin C transport system substrate-binding protein